MLETLDLTRSLARDKYTREIARRQIQLRELSHRMWVEQRPVVVGFEGWDAAGKGGAIKRVTEKPVVFWSGIIDADKTQREVVYNVPDYFDGTLKIMAVAIANDTVGSNEREALIRGPFVITPSVPVLAAPGDQFETGVTVANNVEGSGQNAEIELHAQPNERLTIVSDSTQRLRIAEGREQTAIFKFRANDKLGSGEVTFVAKANGQESKRRATLSVRPPAPYRARSGSCRATDRFPTSRKP